MRKITGIVLIMLLFATSTAFANVDAVQQEELNMNLLESDIVPYSAETRFMMSFTKTNSTTALAEATVLNSEVSDSIECKLQLQVYSNTKGDYVNVTGESYTNRVTNNNVIYSAAVFNISANKDYRVKVTATSKKDGVTENINIGK